MRELIKWAAVKSSSPVSTTPLQAPLLARQRVFQRSSAVHDAEDQHDCYGHSQKRHQIHDPWDLGDDPYFTKRTDGSPEPCPRPPS